MAPRSHGGQQGTAHGVGDGSRLTGAGVNARRSTAGDRGILNANTGAGVNARRSTASGRGGGFQAQRRQRTPQVRGSATGLRSHNGRDARSQGATRSRTTTEFRRALASPMTPGTIIPSTSLAPSSRSPATLPIRQVNSSPGHLSTPFSGPRLTRVFPESQRRLDPISLAGRESSFTMPPKPIRMFNSLLSTSTAAANSSGTPSPIDFISGQGYAPLPSPPKARPIYRGKDDVKRAVTNPNLRAILSDRPYPKERKKAAGERPVLKMGISKEYK